MTLRKEIDKLAEAVIKKATADGATLEGMTDALKVCASYYAVLVREGKWAMGADAEDGGFNFEEGLGALNGKPGIHGRSG